MTLQDQATRHTLRTLLLYFAQANLFVVTKNNVLINLPSHKRFEPVRFYLLPIASDSNYISRCLGYFKVLVPIVLSFLN